MLDDTFKTSRKFLGIPVAILLVAVIAVATGGVALAAYLSQSATVETTVMEPLSYTYNSPFDPATHAWELELYACEDATAYIQIANKADVSVPVTIVATPDVVLEGVTCTVLDNISGLPLTEVPAHYSVTVAVTVSVACDAPIPGGIQSQTWTVDFFRG